MSIFHDTLVQPLFNLLIWLYTILPGADIGFAIIALTIVVKLVLWPLTHKSLTSQKALRKIQPQIKELQTKHKGNKEVLAKEMMALYAAEKVNPASSCLPLLIQLPILFALYRVLSAGLTDANLMDLYSFVSNPEHINVIFIGLIDLSKRSIPLAIIAAALQYWQTSMLQDTRPPKELREEEGAKDEDMMASMNKSMKYVMPVVTLVIGISLPGGLTLYWVAVNAISIFQQWIAFRKTDDDTETPKTPEEPKAITA